MESVMWAFRTLWEKGLIYEGFRVLAYCWRCETPLSNTETRMDDVYQQRQDPAVTVRFRLDSGEDILAWTTTPWTIPANQALNAHPNFDYDLVQTPRGLLILASELRESCLARFGLTGTVLALSRALGETAPLVLAGAVLGSFSGLSLGTFFTGSYTALPVIVYDWSRKPQDAFRADAAAAIVVLLAITLLANLAAILIRTRYERAA